MTSSRANLIRVGTKANAYALSSKVGEAIQGGVHLSIVDRQTFVLSFPAPHQSIVARFYPDESLGGVVVVTDLQSARKAEDAAYALQLFLGLQISGKLILSHVRRYPTGHGFGSSTLDTVATILCLAGAADVRITDEEVAHIAWLAEKAVDGIMFPRPTIFLSRKGEVYQTITQPFPRMRCVTVDTLPADHPGIETLSTSFRYTELEMNQYRQMIEDIDLACLRQDLDLFCEQTTLSATMNQAHVELPRFAHLMDVKKATRAKGVIIAHTGSAATLVYADNQVQQAAEAHQILLDEGFYQVFDGPWRLL